MAQTKASWSACGHIAVAEREVAIAVCVAPTRRDVCWVEHVGVDKLDLLDQVLIEFRMPLFDVLAPEVDAFEEFCALGHFAAVFVHVFLLDELLARSATTSV